MTLWKVLDLILFFGELFAAHTKYTGDDKIVAEAQAALQAYRNIRDADVYREQLNKVTMKWPAT